MVVIRKRGKRFCVPDATIMRLPLYLDKLILLQQAGVKEVSSRQLATSLDLKASQLRHDFHYFGGFSKPGRPYQVDLLVDALREIIGIAEPVPIIIVGAGHLGQGLANYKNFERQGFPLLGVFDIDPELIGTRIRDVEIMPMEQLAPFVKKHGIKIGVLTVPVGVAQEVADQMVEAGLIGIWNFAPMDVKVPDHVFVRNERLAVGLMCLSFKTKRLAAIGEGELSV